MRWTKDTDETRRKVQPKQKRLVKYARAALFGGNLMWSGRGYVKIDDGNAV